MLLLLTKKRKRKKENLQFARFTFYLGTLLGMIAEGSLSGSSEELSQKGKGGARRNT